MKRMRLVDMLAAAWLAALPLLAQVEIVAFQHNGRLVASNLVAGSAATVEWTSSMVGPYGKHGHSRDTGRPSGPRPREAATLIG